VKKRLFIFYLALVLMIAGISTMTALWWNKEDQTNPIDPTVKRWHLVLAKVCPVTIFSLFMLFNIWIQCSNKRISREIIHPWIRCRCSLFIFLFLLPITMLCVELAGIFQYINFSRGKIYVGYCYLMGAALALATYF